MRVNEVSTIEAIRAQFDAAIELFFLSDNFVATHTLAAAGYNALKDIAKKEGEEHPFLKRGFIETLPEEEQVRVFKFLKVPDNFFKHADRDHKETIELDTNLTEILLIDAMGYFKDKPELRPKHFDIFKLWIGHIRKDSGLNDVLRDFVEMFTESVRAKGKKEFWHYVSDLLAKRQQSHVSA